MCFLAAIIARNKRIRMRLFLLSGGILPGEDGTALRIGFALLDIRGGALS